MRCIFVSFPRYFDSAAQKINGPKPIQANSNAIPPENIKKALFFDVFREVNRWSEMRNEISAELSLNLKKNFLNGKILL